MGGPGASFGGGPDREMSNESGGPTQGGFGGEKGYGPNQ